MHLILSPIVGAAIGFIANRLAVKMIFWPYSPVKLFGRTLPFTPGLFVTRRREFASAFARELVDRFIGPRDVVRSLGQALDAGLEEKVLAALPPAAARIARSKIADLTEEDIRFFGTEVSKFIRESNMVSKLVVNNVEAMSPKEIENMAKQVCGRELKAMAWFDAGVGFSVGLVQSLVAYLMSIWV